MKVVYHTNNSGGFWWLKKEEWKALEKAGWTVTFNYDPSDPRPSRNYEAAWEDGDAYKEGITLGAAIREWEEVTGLRSNASGCACCGVPHSFEFTGDDGEVTFYSTSKYGYGDEYDGD